MKKNEKVLADEILRMCDESIAHNSKQQDIILDNYSGKEIEKRYLRDLSEISKIDELVKEKIENYTFEDVGVDESILMEVERLLADKVWLVLKLSSTK